MWLFPLRILWLKARKHICHGYCLVYLNCRMYQDKLAQLKKQLQQLQEGTLPEYLRRLKRIEQHYKERLRLNETWQSCCVCSLLLVSPLNVESIAYT